MNGVYFGNIHSFYDLNLILAPFTPAPAEPKLNFLEIPGRDGHLDLTETNGEVKYNSREFEFIFTVAPGDPLTFDERVSAVSNALNGLRCKITLDRDPDYYWQGRCAVSEYTQDKNIGQITVTATVDPYKLKQNESVVSVELAGELAVTINDDGSMESEDVLYLDCGKYYISNPVEVYFDADHLISFSGFLSIMYGASSSERCYVCNGVSYTFDLYIGLLLYVKKHDLVFGPDGVSMTLENSGKTVCPTITCENNNTFVVCGGETYNLHAGEQKVLGIQLTKGINALELYGRGMVTFRWWERVL